MTEDARSEHVETADESFVDFDHYLPARPRNNSPHPRRSAPARTALLTLLAFTLGVALGSRRRDR